MCTTTDHTENTEMEPRINANTPGASLRIAWQKSPFEACPRESGEGI